MTPPVETFTFASTGEGQVLRLRGASRSACTSDDGRSQFYLTSPCRDS